VWVNKGGLPSSWELPNFSVGLVGLGIGLLIGLNWLVSLYIALALAASSTLVVIRLLKQRQQLV
jgi:predicted Kef-type K+ transport protein